MQGQLLAAGLLYLFATGTALGETAGKRKPLCAPLLHDGVSYTVCTVDPRVDRLRLFWSAGDVGPYGSLRALRSKLAADRTHLRFAMNAGMYDWRLAPIGLYVENGRQVKPLNLADGEGNFHLKPNGVFYLQGKTAGVVDAARYGTLRVKPDFATQSGPMLVIDGRIHPRFSGYAKSMKYRNGVGVRADRMVVFAISSAPVTFPRFAALFRDMLKCPNALYLDGSVSSLAADGPVGSINQGDVWPIGPMIGVTEPD